MKKKSLFKNETQMIVYSLIFTICIILFIVIGKIDFQKDIDTEGKKFHALYDLVPNENLFVFSNDSSLWFSDLSSCITIACESPVVSFVK